ncbi:PAS domain S-box protein [Azoarcus sp. DN11]|uniref:PAS domain S-box protein n=1 Tax=Azoarcus sp. DN11 TaxID=356837 RepID=UPI000EB23859|nr:PAS domain S-box protein [Azoarcus sp. DN11]AYH45252.1 PAS domain-containing sensor histidine kinase [Azoarcus sp. DN11]
MDTVPPPMSPRATVALTTRQRWLTAVPYLTVLLFLVVIAALVWFTRAYDEEEQRATLINDVLWMEQNLQFKLERNASQLEQIGQDILSPTNRHPSQTSAALRQLVRSENGLVRVVWLDAAGHMRGALPPIGDRETLGEPLSEQSAARFRLAQALGRRVYGQVYAAGGRQQFEVHVPIYSENGFAGAMVGVYSLRELVTDELPWWFAERYRVSVLDSGGRELVSKSKVAPLSDRQSYSMAFDPPGDGLTLQVTAYRGETRWVQVLLIGSILLLGGILIWSVLQLRRELQRRHRAEQALRSESLFRRAMEDSMLTGLRARDRNGRITYVNPAFCKMVGYSAEELVGCTPPMPYWDPDFLVQTQEVHDRVLGGNAPPEGFELCLRRKNGERFDALIFEAPLIDAAGRHTGWMGSLLDITAQKRAEELARQQEERLQATSRLITMGEMASTLAHELNQPLAAIASYNTGCLNRLEQPALDREEFRDIFDRIGRQARRAGDIIRRVHDFVRRAEPKREPLDLNLMIREAIGLIEADSAKRGMRIETELDESLPAVAADPVMIEQVIVNLVRNGMDAMRDNPPSRRTMRVSTRREGDMLVVRVADNGTGIDPETARRLFEPFFTTKAEGMGMGLNICRSIAELHHGRLGFEINPDGGTIFTLSLPVESS